MGCDIHAHIEIRYHGKWEHYTNPTIDRWYELFGVMAGVRGEGPPIVEPKGVPNDMSIVTQLEWDSWKEDAHHASWFNEDEIDELTKWWDERYDTKKEIRSLEYDILNRSYLFGSSLTTFMHYHDVSYVPDGVDAVRLIFWFDN